VLAAWLATAGVPQPPPEPAAAPAPVQTSGTESLAQEVQAQAGRLRDRLAAAPAPQTPARNPFAFAPRQDTPARAARTSLAPAAPPSAPAVLPEPGLELIGIAEDQSPQGPIRTAIISAEGGELLMVKVGEYLGARYRVQAIGPDVVELADLTTAAVRRLGLR
jgi:Tfp pilus assembly protein PilP